MSEKFPQNEREKLERKLTALILGELPAHEEAALHRAMDEDPELAALYERLKATIEIVREGSRVEGRGEDSAEGRGSGVEGTEPRGAELKLPPEKREKLLAHFKTVRPKEFVEAPRKRVLFDNRRVRLVEWAAVAAVAVFFAALIMPNFVRTRSTAVKNTIFNNLRLFDGAKQTLALESNLSANRMVNLDEVRPYLGRGSTVVTDDFSVVGETYVMGKVGEAPGIEMGVGKAKRMFGKEIVARGKVHDGRVLLTMDDLLNEPRQTDVADRQTMAALPREAQEMANKKGDFGGQDASVWKPAIQTKTEARLSTLAEANQSETAGFHSQSASSSAKSEIVLPSSNEAAGNGEFALNAPGTAGDQNLSHTNYVVFADSFSSETNYRTLSQLDSGGGQSNLNINYSNLVAGTEAESKTPNLGDIPAMGTAFRSTNGTFANTPATVRGYFNDSVDTNGQIYAGLSRDDVSGLRYLPTKGVVSSQPIDGNGGTVLTWKSFDGSTNTVATYDNPGSAIVLADNSGNTPVVGQTPIPHHVAGIPPATESASDVPLDTNKKAEIALPTMTPPEPAELPAMPIVNFADVSAKLPQRAAGGKQVERAAAANNGTRQIQGEFQNDGDLGLTGTNSFAGRLTVNGGSTPADNSQTAKDTERTRPEHHGFSIMGPIYAEAPATTPESNVKIVLPSEGNPAGNATLTVDPNTSNLIIVTDAGEPNGGIVLPQPGGGGGTGSAGQVPRPAMGGKQVAAAAARVHRGTPWMTDFKKLADSGSNDARALGFDWYLGNMQTNQIVAAGGTTPTPSMRSPGANPEGTFPGAVSGEAPEIAAVEEAVRRENKPQISTAQSVQDGKLLFQKGKLDEADAKMKEALARDPNNQSALYYESLIKQNRAKEVVDARNITEERVELAAAEQKLATEKRWRDILKMKTGEEQVDKDLPKARMVTIIEPASTATTEKVGLGEKLRETLSGKVERIASITVEQEHTDITGLEGPATGNDYDPYFLQTEFNVIQSDAVLKKAAEKLNGAKNGSAAQVTVAQLKRDLDLRPIKNSKEIEIGARGETADQAARIANAVAEAYKDYHQEQYEDLRSRGIQSLQQQLADQNKKVELAQAKVDEIANESHAATTASSQATNQSDSALPKPTVPPLTPQPEILTRQNAFSTFSMNVSDVSFKLAAASLEKGQMPEPASIRAEEFINAFDYRDPEAAPGVPVAFNYERALYPFAHNRELLRFSLKTAAAGRQAGRPLNIVLLLDNSGSMERSDRVRIIQEALRVLAGQLQAQDTFSIVTFARTPRLRVDGIPGNQAAAAAAEVGKFTPEGGTDLGNALDAAYETALHHYLANGDNRVVLLTDGAANLGDVDSNSLKQKVETHRKQGIALDSFGIGWEGYNDDLLEVLTRDGDGRYGFINTPEEASTEFVSQIAGALHVAAADVKVQVEFNPDRVISYRQIGYAKHQLTKEQFRDNTVAAGQIAAQEAGNALYTIEINPQGQGSIGTVRVRYKVPDTGEIREQSWDVPYTGGAVSMEQASPAMRLATTASAFSEWLATSPFAEEVTTDQLLNYLNGVPQVYGADARPQKLEWMIRQAKSISGK